MNLLFWTYFSRTRRRHRLPLPSQRTVSRPWTRSWRTRLSDSWWPETVSPRPHYDGSPTGWASRWCVVNSHG